eukprot:gene3943-3857_t
MSSDLLRQNLATDRLWGMVLCLFAALTLCACEPNKPAAQKTPSGPTFAEVHNMAQLPAPFTRRPQLTSELRLKPGQVLDPNSEFAKTWTGKSIYRKLPNGLVFEIPAQYGWFWQSQDKKLKHRFAAQRLDDLVEEPDVDSWLPYPSMFAYYYTPEYGGLYITWRVSPKHLAHWKEIDTFVWRALKEWTIVNPYAQPTR